MLSLVIDTRYEAFVLISFRVTKLSLTQYVNDIQDSKCITALLWKPAWQLSP